MSRGRKTWNFWMGLDKEKRAFLKQLAITTAFAVPAVQSFSLAAGQGGQPTKPGPTGADPSTLKELGIIK